MRTRFLLAAAICISSTLVFAQSDSTPNTNAERKITDPSFANQTPSAENVAVAAKLDVVLDDLRIPDVTFSNAIDLLRDRTGANIFVNWKSLEAAGIGRGQPISLHLTKVKASTTLGLVLAVASAGKAKVGYTIDEGVVEIATADELGKQTLFTRIYDVRAIVGTGKTRETKSSALIELIADQVEPGSWRDTGGKVAGGKVGAIRELQGQLIVTQTPEGQAGVAKLVAGLNKLAS
jgi:hypothetical protein